MGAGKVRFLLQSRRRTSETKHGVAITGRDKSYPLKPLPKNSFGKNLEFHHNQRDKKDIVNWERDLHQRSISLDRHNLNPHLGYDCIFGFNAEEEDQSRVNARSGDRGTAGVRTNFTYCEQSHANLKNLDELIFRRSFHILNDHSQKRKTDFSKSRNGNYDVEEAANYPLSNFTNNRKLYVNSLESENINQTNFSCKLSAGEPTTSQSFNGKMEGKFRNYVSQSMAPKKLNGPSVSRTLGERNELTGRQEGKESASFDLSNGNVTSPVRKIRKPTPVPLSVAPTNLFQREAKKPSRIESIREVIFTDTFF